MVYTEKLVLRSGPFYHPIVEADKAVLSRYLDAKSCLPVQRGYTLQSVAS